jgi:hypothetical protein
MAKHREVLLPPFLVDDGISTYRMLLEPLWCLIGSFQNRWCRFSDQVELLARFERHEEPIARKYDESIVSENGIFLRVMVDCRRFNEDQELQPFAFSLPKLTESITRGIFGLHPAKENRRPPPDNLERHYENIQDYTAITEIIGLVSMEEHGMGQKTRRKFPVER